MSVTGVGDSYIPVSWGTSGNVQVTLYDVTACREVGNWFSITEYIV